MCSLTILEAKVWRPRCGQGWFPPEALLLGFEDSLLLLAHPAPLMNVQFLALPLLIRTSAILD